MGNTGTQDQLQTVPIPPLSFVPPTVPGLTSSLTRRVARVFGGAGAGGTVTTSGDICQRVADILPITPARYRFRIANSGILGNVKTAGALNFQGIAVGTPTLPVATGLSVGWTGAFASTPKTVIGSPFASNSAGDEVVTPWITNTGEITANIPYAVSIGIGANSTAPIQADNMPCVTGVGAGASSSFAATALPGVNTPYLAMMDIRMEVEFVGTNLIGLFLMDSLGAGLLSGLGQVMPQGW